MSKRTVYTLFTLKFLFSLALIFWTIKMTMGAGVEFDHDNTFFSNYNELDDNYNTLMLANEKFVSKYDTVIKINNNTINELSYDDIYVSQRIMIKRTKNKNLLSLGENTFSLSVIDKNTKTVVKILDAKVIFTRPSTHQDNIEHNLSKSNETKSFTINKKAYWNIMGVIKINNNEGHFFIKTNSQ